MYSAKDTFTSTLLAVVLILGQLGFVHHALDLSSHDDDEPCQLCLLSAGLDQALAQNHQAIEIKPLHGPDSKWHDVLIPATVTTAFLARAPPAISFPT